MAFSNEEDEIECEIIESYGVFSEGVKFWNKEINLVSWNGRPAKLDIRNWQRDHKKCGKGITLTRKEAEDLVRLLSEILSRKPKAEKAGPHVSGGYKSSAGPETPKKKAAGAPRPPEILRPFYSELKTPFGAGPAECKTARNTLLKKYHPDMNVVTVAYATRKTIKIKEAYEKIMAWWSEQAKKVK